MKFQFDNYCNLQFIYEALLPYLGVHSIRGKAKKHVLEDKDGDLGEAQDVLGV